MIHSPVVVPRYIAYSLVVGTLVVAFLQACISCFFMRCDPAPRRVVQRVDSLLRAWSTGKSQPCTLEAARHRGDPSGQPIRHVPTISSRCSGSMPLRRCACSRCLRNWRRFPVVRDSMRAVHGRDNAVPREAGKRVRDLRCSTHLIAFVRSTASSGPRLRCALRLPCARCTLFSCRFSR